MLVAQTMRVRERNGIHASNSKLGPEMKRVLRHKVHLFHLEINLNSAGILLCPESTFCASCCFASTFSCIDTWVSASILTQFRVFELWLRGISEHKQVPNTTIARPLIRQRKAQFLSSNYCLRLPGIIVCSFRIQRELANENISTGKQML